MSRYETQKITLDAVNKRRFYTSLLDITIEKEDTDEYVIVSFGERLDLLAFRYYGDAALWWIIAAANPELRKDSFFLEPGTQVRVPINAPDIVRAYNTFNQI
jgi:nucleoid-associated protein YgaU